ncbi:MAG: LON peptidase substrate-binding domain-containing protein [Bacteroidia bacterium]|nr:LON peptidase substrate-binding domain-containing protein [Bacteroidia bacterium]
MSNTLPLFPLSLVVFPGETLHLHIFEERYKQLVNECLEGGKTFGIPAVINQNVVSVGTEVSILSLDKTYPGGEMDITTEGKKRVRIENFFEILSPKLYPGGEVEQLNEEMSTDTGLQAEVWQLLEELHESLGIQKKYAASYTDLFTYTIGHHVGLTLGQEFELLSLNNELDRLIYVKKHLEAILPVVKETERLKAKAKLNGHYKNIIPPRL